MIPLSLLRREDGGGVEVRREKERWEPRHAADYDFPGFTDETVRA